MNPVLRVMFFAQIWNLAQLGEFGRACWLRSVVLESISDHKHDGTITQRQHLFNKRKPNFDIWSKITVELTIFKFGFIQISSPKSAFAQCYDNFLFNFSKNFLFPKKLTLLCAFSIFCIFFIFHIETSHFFPWFHLRVEQILSILLSDWHQSWLHLEIIQIRMYIVLEFYSNNYSIDFYDVLVDKFFGLINLHPIEISSSESNQ